MSDRIYSDTISDSSENFVLIAQAIGGVLTKHNYPDGSQKSYDHVKLFNFSEHLLTNLYDLYTLSIGMLTQPRCCFIRARIKDKSQGVIRKNNETLILEKCNWVPLDIDWDHPSSGNLLEDSQTALLALPPAFHSAEYFAVASGSYCFKSGIRMRMFFWNKHPISGVDIKNYLSNSIADTALYNPIQLIYTAAPLGVDNVKDRIIWRKPMFPKQLVIPVTDYQHARGLPEIWYTKNRAEKNKVKHLQRISMLSAGDRHIGLITECIPLGKLVGQKHFEREAIIEEALEACKEWIGKREPKKDRDTITWSVDKGIMAMGGEK